MLDAKNVDPGAISQQLRVLFGRFVKPVPCGDCRIGTHKQVIVNGEPARAVKVLRAEVGRFPERHMTDSRTIGERGFRVVEASRSMSRCAREQPGVVVILPSQKFLVMIDFARQRHLMAGRTEFGRLVQRLEKRVSMKGRLGLDELLVDPLQKLILTRCKGVMCRFFDRVIAISTVAVDVGNGMATGAGDACMSGRVADVVEVRIIERTAEEGDRIMTPRRTIARPARCRPAPSTRVWSRECLSDRRDC